MCIFASQFARERDPLIDIATSVFYRRFTQNTAQKSCCRFVTAIWRFSFVCKYIGFPRFSLQDNCLMAMNLILYFSVCASHPSLFPLFMRHNKIAVESSWTTLRGHFRLFYSCVGELGSEPSIPKMMRKIIRPFPTDY